MTGTLVPSRSCNGCTMCCDIPEIPELNKPRMVMCPNCTVGVGCGIYDTRPQTCRAFHCSYLLHPELGEEWRPTTCKMMIATEPPMGRIVVHVDKSHADAWRQEPYFSQIKSWAARSKLGHVLVWQGQAVVVVTRAAEIDLGPARLDQYVAVKTRNIPGGKELYAYLMEPDDPRVKGVE